MKRRKRKERDVRAKAVKAVVDAIGPLLDDENKAVLNQWAGRFYGAGWLSGRAAVPARSKG